MTFRNSFCASRAAACAVVLLAMVGLGGVASRAQTEKNVQVGKPAGKGDDLGLSGFGALSSGMATLNGESQSTADAGGGMLEFRQIRSRMVGFEATYSLQRANQFFRFTGPFPVIPVCNRPPCVIGATGPSTTSVSAMTHEVSGDWILTSMEKNVEFFMVVGVGGRITVPTNSSIGLQTSTSTTLSYIYGFGADWQFRPRWGLRLQYRGDIHKVPQVVSEEVTPFSGGPVPVNAQSGYEHDAEPMVGIYYRF